MTDVHIEDIVEGTAELAELLEDFVETPLLVVFALGAAFAAVFTVLLLLFLLLAIGPVAVVARANDLIMCRVYTSL